MRTIQGIFFDLGWTLETPKSGDWFLTECFNEYVPEKVRARIAPSDWQDAMQTGHAYMARTHLLRGLQEEEDNFTVFYQMITSFFPEIRLSEEDARAIAHDRTYNYANYVPIASTIDTLQKLKDMGYRLGVISDTYPSVVPQLIDMGIDSFFDCVTYSCDLGVLKPDARMYQDALEKMQLPASSLLFVDDIPGNLEAAASFGIHPVLSLAKPGSAPDERFPYINEPADIFTLLKQYDHE